VLTITDAVIGVFVCVENNGNVGFDVRVVPDLGFQM
jgi:hypothetical protein